MRPNAARFRDGNNVVSLTIGRDAVDFSDATTYYKVSTVNYLAAGSCNFNDGGVEPLATRSDRQRHPVLRA